MVTLAIGDAQCIPNGNAGLNMAAIESHLRLSFFQGSAVYQKMQRTNQYGSQIRSALTWADPVSAESLQFIHCLHLK